ncbi:TPA: phage antirepressor N-terminal domain-containing protein [Klebsiella pneumoniae]|uniref:phage antirepressor N-terminal domain-containing protein n=1 Tax=Klebsiella pneumoniae TaxID=573 RepID=UPI000C2D4030|nr:phage antirepressor N-terminal domain-containing protein [Klebsiella pneumoniae]AUB47426.1 putative antirepressor protein [Klebsiella pneumoniae]HCD9795766.1 phage antirepressor N-terminal domain-containing protein [Klebsiella pneumoniae]HCD9935329.1 phage antirepressor N-terminal domain-containing protein [Klebsiella pneumoniae]HCE0024526.1 phage antirepressor N-terminal domain-containing protein [Klebsiella pneumoniae]HCE0369007.1 phage antirepressor N-terminal domain-containing protein [
MTSIAILEAVNTSYVPFNGQQVITAVAAGVTYVAMRQIVENIGMDWTGQSVKLRKMKDRFNCRDISMVAADGKLRKLLCLPLKKLNGWLFSINPEKVRADIRDKLIKYQEECFTVLHDYWTKGEVKNPRKKTTVDERTPLRDAVNMLVSKRHMMYPEAYAMIHQRFNVESIEDLDANQIPDAIEYVHRVALEGEFLGKQEALPAPKLDIHYPADWWDQFPLLQRERKIQKSTAAGGYQFPVMLLYGFEDESPSAISSLISKLAMQGYDVSAVKMEYLAHRHYAERMYQKLSRIAEISGSVLGSSITLNIQTPMRS